MNDEFDFGLLEWLENPSYYNGVYNAVAYVVLLDDTIVAIPPDSSPEFHEAVRSYVVDAEALGTDGEHYELRIEKHHIEDRIEHVHVVTDGAESPAQLPAKRWGLDRQRGVVHG